MLSPQREDAVMRREQVVAWKAEVVVDQQFKREFMERAAKVLAGFEVPAQSDPLSVDEASDPLQPGARSAAA
jgi:hypothetical protein